MKKFLAYVNVIRTIPAILIYLLLFDKKEKSVVRMDINRNLKERDSVENLGILIGLSYCLTHFIQFRSIYSYRINRKNKLLARLNNLFYRPMRDIELSGDIGGGLIIWHGYGLVCVCNKIGDNCTLYQGVTIGRNPNGEEIDTPSIGNNVYIYSNAVVAGNIEIGDNVIIGAGSIVMKSVEVDSVMAGNPAKRIR